MPIFGPGQYISAFATSHATDQKKLLLYEDSSLTFRLRGGSLKVFACRTFLSVPMATKNAGSREEKYIFHRKKIIFSRRIFGSKFFSRTFS